MTHRDFYKALASAWLTYKDNMTGEEMKKIDYDYNKVTLCDFMSFLHEIASYRRTLKD